MARRDRKKKSWVPEIHPLIKFVGAAMVLLGFGAVLVGAAWFEWDFFWRQAEARILSSLIGHEAARVFYFISGLAMFCALLIFFGPVALDSYRAHRDGDGF